MIPTTTLYTVSATGVYRLSALHRHVHPRHQWMSLES
jgi:hypothetical protein